MDRRVSSAPSVPGQNLPGDTSGFAVPTYVIDAPGGGGKIPVMPKRLEVALVASHKLNKAALVHLELETGLNRTGLALRELNQAAGIIASAHGSIQLEGLCTHFAGAESSANFFRIQAQMGRFEELCQAVAHHGLKPRLKHTACSAAALAYPDSVMDMVRIGIAAYGFWPSEETRLRVIQQTHLLSPQRQDPLARVMHWSSEVMNVKAVGPGEFVGYGNAYLTTRSQRIAAVPVGYYHGFARSLGNLGHVLVHGRRARVIGNVNMNMMLIDITDIPGVQPGDEVVIIGRQKRAQITVGAFSDLTRDLNYEVLVRIPASIPRKIV